MGITNCICIETHRTVTQLGTRQLRVVSASGIDFNKEALVGIECQDIGRQWCARVDTQAVYDARMLKTTCHPDQVLRTIGGGHRLSTWDKEPFLTAITSNGGFPTIVLPSCIWTWPDREVRSL